MSRPQTNPEPQIAPELCEEALRRVLASQTFARAEKSQRFLKFVSELTLRGEGASIHEHLVAVEVFGRGDEYSSGEDSVVRRQAHSLRRKLKDYYEAEGRLDEVVIELPIGSYMPVFKHQQATPAGTVLRRSVVDGKALGGMEPDEAPARGDGTKGRFKGVAVGVSVLAGILLFASGWLIRGVRQKPPSPGPVHEAVREIWAPWLSGGPSGAVLCFSNPPTTSVRLFSGPLQPNPEHQGLGVTAAQDEAFRRFFGFPSGGHIYLYPLAAQAKMGEALAAVTLTNFFAHAGVTVRATQSRLLNWETMREENVILLGHADSNRWIEPVLASAPFMLAQTDAQRRARIINSRPSPGEQPEYFPTIPDGNRSYALVSMLAGVDGTHEILVLGGLDTSSTMAAAEYLMSEDSARDLLRRLREAAPGHKGHWRFQVVLQTDVRDTVPLRAFPVALRVM